MEHFFWVSFGRPFWRAWFRACVCISHCLPCVQMPLLAGRGSIKGPMGRASLSITLLLTTKEPFCAGVLTSRMRNTWPLIFYLGRAQLPLSIVLLLIFWSFSLQGMNLQLLYPGGGGHLPPASKGGSQPNSASDSTQEEWTVVIISLLCGQQDGCEARTLPLSSLDLYPTAPIFGFPGGASGKEPACQCRRHKRRRFDPYVGKIPWRREWQPTPVFLSGEAHGLKSLGNCSPWGHKELDTIEVTEHSCPHF